LIVLVLPHAIGTSKHDVPHPQGHDAVDVEGILHAFADPVADQQQVRSYAITPDAVVATVGVIPPVAGLGTSNDPLLDQIRFLSSAINSRALLQIPEGARLYVKLRPVRKI
jgi:hypothetical protein